MKKETVSRIGSSERGVVNGEKRILKLGLDTHYWQVTVAMQEDGGRIKARRKKEKKTIFNAGLDTVGFIEAQGVNRN